MKVITHLKNLLPKKKKTQAIMTVPENTELENERLYEKILQNLKNQRAPLSIKFGHSPSPYVSMLLDIDVNRKFIIIDEINNEEGHRQMCMSEPFTLSGRDNGIFVLFQSKIIDFGTIHGISFYRLPYPRHIEYLQRRVTPRLAIPLEMAMHVDFLLPGQPYVRTNIVDISLSGLRFSISRNVKSILENVIKIDHCRLITPFASPQEFTLEIKHCRYELNKQQTIVGCQFVDMDNVGLKFLSSLINRLQQYSLSTP